MAEIDTKLTVREPYYLVHTGGHHSIYCNGKQRLTVDNGQPHYFYFMGEPGDCTVCDKSCLNGMRSLVYQVSGLDQILQLEATMSSPIHEPHRSWLLKELQSIGERLMSKFENAQK